MMTLAFLGIGLALGVLISYFFFKSKNNQEGVPAEKYNQLDKEKTILEDRIANSIEVFQQQKTELEQQRGTVLQLNNELTRWQADFRNLDLRMTEQKAEIENLQQKFTDQFKAIAGDILDNNSKKFSETNHNKITELLTPLKEKIQSFEKKVDDAYEKEMKDKESLRKEVQLLHDLNQRISEEASNLTKALKGDAKKQGNWGEVILERILERSGLTEGEGYTLQGKDMKLTDTEGNRLQPDVIINLPDKKHIIIDAKVSLVAYERLINTEIDADRESYIKQHLISLRKHVSDLSDKDYQNLYGINSPDFVLLFIPIESSFSVAVQADQDLFSYAWDRKIVIVSPSTLLATLRTIASIWKQEQQTKNAIEIARQSGALYDKFVGFVEDLKKVGNSLGNAQRSYTDALGKLQDGKGNLIGSVERIRKLGAKSSKSLDRHIEEEEEVAEE